MHGTLSRTLWASPTQMPHICIRIDSPSALFGALPAIHITTAYSKVTHVQLRCTASFSNYILLWHLGRNSMYKTHTTSRALQQPRTIQGEVKIKDQSFVNLWLPTIGHLKTGDKWSAVQEYPSRVLPALHIRDSNPQGSLYIPRFSDVIPVWKHCSFNPMLAKVILQW